MYILALHQIVPEGREPSPPASRSLRPVTSVGLRDVHVAPGSGKCRALAFEGGESSVLGQRGSVALGLSLEKAVFAGRGSLCGASQVA